METFTRVISKIIIFMVMAHLLTLMAIRIWVIGNKADSMVREYILGLMAINIWVIIKMT